jgi:hypothetical protein
MLEQMEKIRAERRREGASDPIDERVTELDAEEHQGMVCTFLYLSFLPQCAPGGDTY